MAIGKATNTTAGKRADRGMATSAIAGKLCVNTGIRIATNTTTDKRSQGLGVGIGIATKTAAGKRADRGMATNATAGKHCADTYA